MSYYIDSILKFDIDTFEEFLDFGVEKAKEERTRMSGSVIEPYDVNATRETIEELFENEIYLDTNGSICISTMYKYGTFANYVIDEFVKQLQKDERDNDFTLASVGEELSDMEWFGNYDDCVYIERVIEPNLNKPMKLKKGTFFVKIDLGGKK